MTPAHLVWRRGPVGGETIRALMLFVGPMLASATMTTWLNRLGGVNEIPYLALPCGTAVKINEAIRGLLRSNQQGDASESGQALLFRFQKTGKSSRKNRERFSPNRFNL
jgi:hypothetical protein